MKNKKILPGDDKKKIFSVSLDPKLVEIIKKNKKYNLSNGITEIVQKWILDNKNSIEY